MATAAPWTPQSDLNLSGGIWLKIGDLADGAVSDYPSHEGLGQHLVQATGSAQPVKTGNTLAFVSANSQSLVRTTNTAKFVRRGTLPDSSWGNTSGATGVGLICTGMCRKIGSTTRFMIWGHGDTSAAKDGSGPWEPTMMEVEWLPGQNPTKILEVRLSPLIPGIQSVQGGTPDTVAGTYWFASANAPGLLKVYEINWPAGTLTGRTLTPTNAPNGLASIDAEDAMWIGQNASNGNNWEKRNRSTGAVIVASASHAQSNADMLHYNAATGGMLYTKGANGVPGVAQMFATSAGSTAAPVNVGSVTFDSHYDCPEGGVWEGQKFYGTSDAHYHGGSDGLNQIVEYDIVPLMATEVNIHTKVRLTTAASSCILEIGGGSDGPLDGYGIGIYAITATTLTVAVNTLASGSTQRGIINAAVVPDLTAADRRISVKADMVNKTLTLWVDGTQISSVSISSVVGGLSMAGTLRLGDNSKSTHRYLNGAIKGDVGIITGPSNRAQWEAYLAAQ